MEKYFGSVNVEQTMYEINKLNREIYNNGQNKIFTVWKNENGHWKSYEKEFAKLAHFAPMEGTMYRENGHPRLLVIGRAVNGWFDTDATNECEYGDQMEKAILQKGFDWVVEEKGILYNKNDNGTKGDYKVSSPFWSVTKSVFEYLNKGAAETPKWVECIAWTNLYKVAPTFCGNPEGELKNLQKKQSIDLLKCEIQYFAPTHILAVTGWKDWMEDFAGLFDADSLIIYGENIAKGKKKNNIYLEAEGKINKIPVAIACRPEFRPKEEYVANVVRAFDR